MKKRLSLLIILTALASCGGKEGPAGPQGPPGKDGTSYASYADKVADFSNRFNYVSQKVSLSIVKPFSSVDNFVIFQTCSSSPPPSCRFFVSDLTNYDIAVGWGHQYVGEATQVPNVPSLFKLTDPYPAYAQYANFYLSEDSETRKDVEFIGSRIESAEVESVKENLLSFGLSVERTEKLAKLMTSYRKISNKRALNATEKDQFTKELLGMTFNQAAKKMVEDYDGLIETAADRNGTSPEAVKELVNSFLTR